MARTWDPQDDPDSFSCPVCTEDVTATAAPKCGHCGWELATDEDFLASIETRAEARKEARDGR